MEETTSLQGMAVTEELLNDIGYTKLERAFVYNGGDIREDHMLGLIRSMRSFFLALGIESEDKELRCAAVSLMEFEAGDHNR